MFRFLQVGASSYKLVFGCTISYKPKPVSTVGLLSHTSLYKSVYQAKLKSQIKHYVAQIHQQNAF